jgi:RNA polymerase sigma-70 factor (ECF subfamily)
MSSRPHENDVIGLLGPLRRYARALTRDETTAEDLVHDALVRAFERRSTFHLGGNLRAWLFAILHNTFVDGRRRRVAEARREEAVAGSLDVAVPASQETSIHLEQVRRAFAILPEEQRAVLHLVAIEGLPYQEAAHALGIPVGTLMSRLGRARAALRSFEEARPADRPRLPSPARPKLRIVGGDND